MKMHSLDSTMLSTVGYDPATKELHATYKKGGGLYVYQDVPESRFQALLAAKSHGQFFREHVIPKHKQEKRS